MLLPKIYHGDLKTITYHNKDYCYIDENHIDDTIDYKEKYYIKTIQKEIKTYITYKNRDYIKTLEGEKFMLKDIIEIKRIS